MKSLPLLFLFLVLAAVLAGCAGKQAPYVDMSTPQAKQAALQKMESDPSIPPGEKAAYAQAINGFQPGASSHAPAKTNMQRQ